MYNHFLCIKDTTGNIIIYADIGPASLDQNQPPTSVSTLTFDLDEHRVEYAQLNHKALSSKPVSAINNFKSTDDSGGIYYRARPEIHET